MRASCAPFNKCKMNGGKKTKKFLFNPNDPNKSFDVYIDKEYVSRGLKERNKQKEERDLLNKSIDEAMAKIADLNNSKSSINIEQLKLEADVGPLKYVAELIYGDNAKDHFDSAVRIIILILIFVFDPLAVLLLIAANITLKEEKTRRRRKVTRTRKKQEKKDQTAWERKLKETKESKGGLTKVVHENNGMKAEYYE